MIKIEKDLVEGWYPAIRGARNPMNSWDRMDSYLEYEYDEMGDCVGEEFIIGPNDHKLLSNLAKAGPDHGKFMRMIIVFVDITAPLYWWKEFDTYKVATVANSCSTMHKIHAKEFTLEDFSCEHLQSFVEYKEGYDVAPVWDFMKPLEYTIDMLNRARKLYIETKDKEYWWQMIQLLPSSYNQKRTVMLNYEVLKNMYHARKNHKLDEWHDLCKWMESLPYSELITGEKK